jgi:hypothetical protein
MTPWRILWKTLLGGALALAGFGTLAYVEFWHFSHHPLVARMPLSMSVGHVHSGDFKVDISCPYIVLIDFDQPDALPDNRLDCLSGVVAPEDHCGAVLPVLSVAWTLSSEGQSVGSGSSDSNNAFYWDRGPTRILGGFRGEAGAHYDLDLEIRSDGTALSPASPVLQIRPANMQYYSDFAIERGLIRVAAVACLLVGVLFLFLAQLQRRRFRKFNYTNS